MRRVFTVAVMIGLALLASAVAVGQSPPPYPGASSITFELVGPWRWHAVEPDWDCPSPRRPFYGGAEVAPDGTVWFIDRGGIRELGACPILERDWATLTRDHAFAPDGTLWVLDEDRLMWWDGDDWVIEAEDRFNQPGSSGRDPAPCVIFVDVAPDGTVWLSGTILSAFDGNEWTDYMEDRTGVLLVGFGPDGGVWVHQLSEGEDGGFQLIQPG
jgi:hypothetical protein